MIQYGSAAPTSDLEVKSAGKAVRKLGVPHAGIVKTSNGRSWNAALHPRDSQGRFIETGGTARIGVSGKTGKVVRVKGRNRIELELANGEHRDFDARQLTMLKRPDGAEPVKDDGSEHAKDLVAEQDEKRLADPKRGDGIDTPDPGDRDGDGIPDELDADPDDPEVREKILPPLADGEDPWSDEVDAADRIAPSRFSRATGGKVVINPPYGEQGEPVVAGRIEPDPDRPKKFRAVASDGTVLAGTSGSGASAQAMLIAHHNKDSSARLWKPAKGKQAPGSTPEERTAARKRFNDAEALSSVEQADLLTVRDDPQATKGQRDAAAIELGRRAVTGSGLVRGAETPNARGERDFDPDAKVAESKYGDPVFESDDVVKAMGMPEGTVTRHDVEQGKTWVRDEKDGKEYDFPSTALELVGRPRKRASDSEQPERSEKRDADAFDPDAKPVRESGDVVQGRNGNPLLHGRVTRRDEDGEHTWVRDSGTGKEERHRDEDLSLLERTGRPEPSDRDTDRTTSEEDDRDDSSDAREAREDVLGDVPAQSGGDDERPDDVLPQAGRAGERAGERGDGAVRPADGDRGSDADERGAGGSGAGGQEGRGGDRGGRPGDADAGAGDGEPQGGRDDAAGLGGRPDGVATPEAPEAPAAPKVRPRTTKSKGKAGAAPRFTPKGQQDLAPKGQDAKLAANMAALRALRKIQAEDRPATREEQAVLARWAGWGNLADVFEETGAKADRWPTERAALKELLSQKEYAAAKTNTLNAHYTDAALVDEVWNALDALGFTGGDVLEPGSGSGNFIGRALHGARMTGVELDPVTSGIASLLYPDAEVLNESFATSPFNKDVFDAAIGNVPFGNFAATRRKGHNPLGLSIHDQFLGKAMESVKPGGVGAFITSQFSMNSQDDKARRAMYEHSDLVGAIRLPAKAHADAAGTDVVTDLLIFRKRKPGEKRGDDSWLRSAPAFHPDGRPVTGTAGKDKEPKQLWSNAYFDTHPENVLGEVRDGGYNGLAVVGQGQVAPKVREAVQRLTAQAKQTNRSWNPDVDPDGVARAKRASGSTREGHVTYAGEQSVDKLNPKTGRKATATVARFETIEDGRKVDFDVPTTQAEEVRRLLELRDLFDAVIARETETPDDDDEDLLSLRKRLGRAYDDYVREHGPITRFEEVPQFDAEGNEKAPRRKVPPAITTFRQDEGSASVFGLEHGYDTVTGKAQRADVFTRRQIDLSRQVAEHTDDPHDAIALATERSGGRGLTIEAIADVLGMKPAQARNAVRGLVFPDPDRDGALVDRPTYLSGNVRQKLATARTAAEADPRYGENVEELEKLLPADATLGDVPLKMGASWISPQVMTQFAKHLMGHYNDVAVSYEDGRWSVKTPREKWARNEQLERGTWGTEDVPFYKLLELALRQQHQIITVKKKDSEGNSYVDTKASAAAVEKASEIEQEFTDWVWGNSALADGLTAAYTEKFRSIVPKSYDDVPTRVMPGMSADVTLLPHQNAAITRAVSEPSVLLEHVVGSGKTFTLAGTAMEMRRLGLARKPVLAVPGHMLEQWTREFRELYPQAKILAADSESISGAKNRKAFASRAANSDWDVVLMTHEAFESIPVSAGWEEKYLSDEIDLLTRQWERAQKGDATPAQVKAIQKKVEKAKAKLDEQMARRKDDDGITFEALGFDYVMADEAHVYKNLNFSTMMQGVSSPEGSGRARDMHMKLELLRSKAPTDGSERIAAFATGTPISNSLAEMYTMTRFMRPDLLREAGVEDFDAWAATFANVSAALEQDNAAGGYVERIRMRGFSDALGDGLRLWRTFSDTKTVKHLTYLKRPKIKGGERSIHAVKRTDEQQAALGSFKYRIEHMPRGKPQKGDDTHVAVIGDGRRAALDPRLMSERGLNAAGIDKGEEMESPKIEAAANNIADVWARTKDNEYRLSHDSDTVSPDKGALQMVMVDASAPKKDQLSAYSLLRDALVARGMDPSRIRFIQEAAGSADKKARIQEEARQGKIDVIIGGSMNLGTGTNVQNRLYALHHLDGSWKPSDIEQREGRILRQGNQHDEVELHVYVTEDTHDVKTWDLTAIKQAGLTAIAEGDYNMRAVEFQDDVDPLTDYDTITGAGSSNPHVKSMREAQAGLKKLAAAERSHNNSVERARSVVRDGRVQAASIDESVAKLRAANTAHQDTTGDKFTLLVRDDYTYNDKAITSRADAAAALGAMFAQTLEDYGRGSHTRDSPAHMDRVRIGGFDLQADYVQQAGRKPFLRLALSGSEMHRDRLPLEPIYVTRDDLKSGMPGVLAKLENRANGLEDRARRFEFQKAALNEKIGAATLDADKPFRRAEEAKEARRRTAVLEALVSGERDAINEKGESFKETLKPEQVKDLEAELADLDAAAAGRAAEEKRVRAAALAASTSRPAEQTPEPERPSEDLLAEQEPDSLPPPVDWSTPEQQDSLLEEPDATPEATAKPDDVVVGDADTVAADLTDLGADPSVLPDATPRDPSMLDAPDEARPSTPDVEATPDVAPDVVSDAAPDVDLTTAPLPPAEPAAPRPKRPRKPRAAATKPAADAPQEDSAPTPEEPTAAAPVTSKPAHQLEPGDRIAAGDRVLTVTANEPNGPDRNITTRDESGVEEISSGIGWDDDVDLVPAVDTTPDAPVESAPDTPVEEPVALEPADVVRDLDEIGVDAPAIVEARPAEGQQPGQVRIGGGERPLTEADDFLVTADEPEPTRPVEPTQAGEDLFDATGGDVARPKPEAPREPVTPERPILTDEDSLFGEPDVPSESTAPATRPADNGPVVVREGTPTPGYAIPPKPAKSPDVEETQVSAPESATNGPEGQEVPAALEVERTPDPTVPATPEAPQAAEVVDTPNAPQVDQTPQAPAAPERVPVDGDTTGRDLLDALDDPERAEEALAELERRDAERVSIADADERRAAERKAARDLAEAVARSQRQDDEDAERELAEEREAEQAERDHTPDAPEEPQTPEQEPQRTEEPRDVEAPEPAPQADAPDADGATPDAAPDVDAPATSEAPEAPRPAGARDAKRERYERARRRRAQLARRRAEDDVRLAEDERRVAEDERENARDRDAETPEERQARDDARASSLDRRRQEDERRAEEDARRAEEDAAHDQGRQGSRGRRSKGRRAERSDNRRKNRRGRRALGRLRRGGNGLMNGLDGLGNGLPGGLPHLPRKPRGRGGSGSGSGGDGAGQSYPKPGAPEAGEGILRPPAMTGAAVPGGARAVDPTPDGALDSYEDPNLGVPEDLGDDVARALPDDVAAAAAAAGEADEADLSRPVLPALDRADLLDHLRELDDPAEIDAVLDELYDRAGGDDALVVEVTGLSPVRAALEEADFDRALDALGGVLSAGAPEHLLEALSQRRKPSDRALRAALRDTNAGMMDAWLKQLNGNAETVGTNLPESSDDLAAFLGPRGAEMADRWLSGLTVPRGEIAKYMPEEATRAFFGKLPSELVDDKRGEFYGESMPGGIRWDDWKAQALEDFAAIDGVDERDLAAADAARLADAVAETARADAFTGAGGAPVVSLPATAVRVGDLLVDAERREPREVLGVESGPDGGTYLTAVGPDGRPEVTLHPQGAALDVASPTGDGPLAPPRTGSLRPGHGGVLPADGDPKQVPTATGVPGGRYTPMQLDALGSAPVTVSLDGRERSGTLSSEPGGRYRVDGITFRPEEVRDLAVLSGQHAVPGAAVGRARLNPGTRVAVDTPDGALVGTLARVEPDGTAVLDRVAPLGRSTAALPEGTIGDVTIDGEQARVGVGAALHPLHAVHPAGQTQANGLRPGEWARADNGALVATSPGEWRAAVVPTEDGAFWSASPDDDRLGSSGTVSGTAGSLAEAKRAAVEAVMDLDPASGTLPRDRAADVQGRRRPANAPAEAPEPIDGQAVEWVSATQLGMGDIARLSGFTWDGASTSAAGYVLGSPAPATSLAPDGQRTPMMSVVIGEHADGTGRRQAVFARIDAVAARAPQGGEGGANQAVTGSEADVLADRLPSQLPTGAGEMGLFPGTAVTDTASGRKGTVVASRLNDVEVSWENGKGGRVGGATLRVTDGGAARPAGWTRQGRRITTGLTGRAGKQEGSVAAVVGDEVTLSTPAGMQVVAAKDLVITGAAAKAPTEVTVARKPLTEVTDGETVMVPDADGNPLPATVTSANGGRVDYRRADGTTGTLTVTDVDTVSDGAGRPAQINGGAATAGLDATGIAVAEAAGPVVSTGLSQAQRGALNALGFDLDGVSDPDAAQAAARLRAGLEPSAQQASALSAAIRDAISADPDGDSSRTLERVADALDEAAGTGRGEVDGGQVTAGKVGIGDTVTLPGGGTATVSGVHRDVAASGLTGLDLTDGSGATSSRVFNTEDQLELVPRAAQPLGEPRTASEQDVAAAETGWRTRTADRFAGERGRAVADAVAAVAVQALDAAVDAGGMREQVAARMAGRRLAEAVDGIVERLEADLDRQGLTGAAKEQALAAARSAATREAARMREGVLNVLSDLPVRTGGPAASLRREYADAINALAKGVPLTAAPGSSAAASLAKRAESVQRHADRYVADLARELAALAPEGKVGREQVEAALARMETLARRRPSPTAVTALAKSLNGGRANPSRSLLVQAAQMLAAAAAAFVRFLVEAVRRLMGSDASLSVRAATKRAAGQWRREHSDDQVAQLVSMLEEGK